jgi:hypothetical protein
VTLHKRSLQTNAARPDLLSRGPRANLDLCSASKGDMGIEKITKTGMCPAMGLVVVVFSTLPFNQAARELNVMILLR